MNYPMFAFTVIISNNMSTLYNHSDFIVKTELGKDIVSTGIVTKMHFLSGWRNKVLIFVIKILGLKQ